jgi:hypothetical protein
MTEVDEFDYFDKRLEDLRRLLDAHDLRLEQLRQADKEAVRVAHEDLSERLKGFPQQFATKDEMKAVADVVTKLDKDTVSRELYDQRHTALAEVIAAKLNESVFVTFVENYRIDQENAASERRAVATSLATATAHEIGEKTGIGASAGLLVGGLGVLGGLITIGLIVSNLL